VKTLLCTAFQSEEWYRGSICIGCSVLYRLHDETLALCDNAL
jgi:hypothetical protein